MAKKHKRKLAKDFVAIEDAHFPALGDRSRRADKATKEAKKNPSDFNKAMALESVDSVLKESERRKEKAKSVAERRKKLGLK